jgi:hypothetical protein
VVIFYRLADWVLEWSRAKATAHSAFIGLFAIQEDKYRFSAKSRSG